VIDPTHLEVGELLDRYRTGELAPSEAVSACLHRIANVDTDVGSVITPVVDRALVEAGEADRRWAAGTARPLEGIPFGVKDVIDTAGVRTTYGSPLFETHVPSADAASVAALRAAGAVLIAKLQTYEFAFGGNPHFGPAHNPWDLERTAGGSSEGPGAALAARLLPLSLATDTGGSIRIPAAFCGVTGFKPSAGAVSTVGVFPHAPSLDHVGPMARSASDCALALAALTGRQPPPARPSLSSMRVGVPSGVVWDVLDPDVEGAARACIDLLGEAGATVVAVDVPGLDLAEQVCWTVIAAETAASHRPRWETPDVLGPALQDLIRGGRSITAVDYLHAIELAGRVVEGAQSVFERCDLLVMPGPPCTAPRLDDMLARLGDDLVPWLDVVARTTMWHNVAGCPVVALPFGLGRDGMPVSVQLSTRAGSDFDCLTAAAEVQERSGYHRLTPPLPG